MSVTKIKESVDLYSFTIVLPPRPTPLLEKPKRVFFTPSSMLRKQKVCGLLMPPTSREAYFALRAFNVEIASIKDSSRLLAGRSRGGGGGGGGVRSRFADNDAYEGGGGGGGGDASLATRLRMRWWRDAISGIYDGMSNAAGGNDDFRGTGTSSYADDGGHFDVSSSARRNPTIRSLAHAIRTHGLTHRFLRRLVEAREMDLDIVQYDGLRDVAQYGEDTSSSVLYLTLECLGVSLCAWCASE